MQTQNESAKEWVTKICQLHGFDEERIIGKRRKWPLVAQRWKVGRYLRSLGYSYPEIGYALNRDHASVIFGLKSPRTERRASTCAVVVNSQGGNL